MAGAARKWFIGCGIGCGLMLLLAVIGGTIGYFGVRKAVDRGERIEAGFDDLRDMYGGPAEFTPEPDGAVATSRMLAFLAARDAMAADREKAGDILRTLDGIEVDGRQPSFLDKARAGFELIPVMMDFIDNRNQALMDSGIGLGEYLYIYSMSYFNLLGKPLSDGPSFTLTSDDEGEDNHGFHWDAGGKGNSEDTRADREKTIRRYLHRVQLRMAFNQLDALDARGGSQEDRARLSAEIALMESEPLRLLWETGLPPALAQSLDPYRGQLEASYDPMINVLESGLVESE
jgi:hypothetical protein